MGTKQPLGSMPESSAGTEGGTAGSTGGASKSDIEKGYTRLDERTPYDPYVPFASLEEDMPQGFLDRPKGYER